MARVLFAWEFGGDLGHARRLVPIAREVRALGHEPLFAFRDLAQLGALARDGFEWFAAPHLRMPASPDPSPLNASDILLNLGYRDSNAIVGALRAWLSLFGLVTPAIVVADYAPTAMLAARAAGIPRLTIGTGFSLPPQADPLPALRSWHEADDATLRKLDQRLIDTVTKALDRLSKTSAAPRSAAELFEARAHLLCTFPEIDPFGPRDGVEYLGPQGDAEAGSEARWNEARAPRVFSYLKPRDPRFERIVNALRDLGGDAIVAAPGLDATSARMLSGEGVRVFPEALRLDPLLPSADLCVFHGGPGLAARALVAGVPMALLPMQLEQYLVGSRLVDAGVAAMLAPETPTEGLGAWIASGIADVKRRGAARERAGAYSHYRFDQAAAKTAERIAMELG